VAATDELRSACAEVSRRARHVQVNQDAIGPYAANLPISEPPAPDPAAHLLIGPLELRAAFWLTLDAINFGSGWFPTLRKLPGQSGYFTIASGLRNRFARSGAWSAEDLARIETTEIADLLGQRPDHELMRLFASSLRDLGANLQSRHGSSFASVIDLASGSAVRLAETLGGWPCFADTSTYDEITIPFLKRAQIAAADLARAGLATFNDLESLTMFADNLVPHVLRLDGVLSFAPELTTRIEREELLAHGSPEEVEIRACALHAVEQIVAAHRATAARPATTAMEVDALLWHRGREPRYKATPRHRCRCIAY
jgi:Potential Queuosine, Q, salvage protein family